MLRSARNAYAQDTVATAMSVKARRRFIRRERESNGSCIGKNRIPPQRNHTTVSIRIARRNQEVLSGYTPHMTRTVIHTDEQGNDLGDVGLIAAHTGTGILHRAFSVYVFNPDHSKLMIQKRAATKMLWPNFFANTCCSHPFRGETATQAGERRLREELGFTCPLREGSVFTYRAEEPSGRGVEHEYDTILTGIVTEDQTVNPNPDEVSEWKWIDLETLHKRMTNEPDLFTPWFHLGLPKAVSDLRS